MIPALFDKIKEVDPDFEVDWGTHEGNKVFQRAFICPSGTRHTLKYSHLMISLDTCHTKNNKFPCQLFVAMVLDGEMRGYNLCYAIAPMENTNNWSWFLSLMEKAQGGHLEKVNIMCDK